MYRVFFSFPRKWENEELENNKEHSRGQAEYAKYVKGGFLGDHFYQLYMVIINSIVKKKSIAKKKRIINHARRKALSELEQSRDDLLFELHKLQQKQYSCDAI